MSDGSFHKVEGMHGDGTKSVLSRPKKSRGTGAFDGSRDAAGGNNMNGTVIVVGGGPSGMMAAIAAGRSGHKVTLLERNPGLGRKLLITGNGRCNVTNGTDLGSMEDVRGHVVSNPKFLYHAFSAFTNRGLLDLLAEAGLKTKMEEGGRVFPASDRAEDVREALLVLLRRAHVRIRCSCRVLGLLIDNPASEGEAEDASVSRTERAAGAAEPSSGKGPRGKKPNIPRCVGVVTEDGEKLYADWVIVTTGGLAAPALGSDGDGYRLAKDCGHRIVPCRPALVPVKTEEDLSGLQGVAFPHVRIQAKPGAGVKGGKAKKKGAEKTGPLMITHYGLSGPAVLNLSSYFSLLEAANQKADQQAKDAESAADGRNARDPGSEQNPAGGKIRLILDFLPGETREETEAYLLAAQKSSPHKKMKNLGFTGIPSAAAEALMKRSGVDPDGEVGVLKKKERGRLLENLHALELNVSGTRGFREAVITQGGVRTQEIDGKTMASRKCAGLKFAGEVLDLDAETGGYNLQIAWSTGWTAGSTL